jgi:acyl dehydratase
MAKIVINNFAEFEAYSGRELGVSDYHKITQDQINHFADATLDHQWIHTDPARAERESQFKKTIAHGFLTVSIIPYLWHQIAEVNNIKMLVNYVDCQPARYCKGVAERSIGDKRKSEAGV